MDKGAHNLIHLHHVYPPLVQTDPAVTREVRKWTDDSAEALRDCFGTTVWPVLCAPHGEDINAKSECISSYKLLI